jgi:hypothetical protein
MLDEKLFNPDKMFYMSEHLFTYEKSAIYQHIQTDIYNFANDGTASLKPQYMFIGYTDPRKLKFKPSTKYYVMMVFDKSNSEEFWLHVDDDIFLDIIKPYQNINSENT